MQENRRASGLVFMSPFMAVLNHSAYSGYIRKTHDTARSRNLDADILVNAVHDPPEFFFDDVRRHHVDGLVEVGGFEVVCHFAKGL